MPSLAWVVFHNPDWCDGPAVSPMVHNLWPRPVVELLLDSQALFTTNDVELACARFIGWCHTNSEVDTLLLGIQNVTEQPDPEDVEDQAVWNERLAAWYARVMRRLGSWELAVLVDLATHQITQNGVVLWRPERLKDPELGGKE
jgi:hypothetical protein